MPLVGFSLLLLGGVVVYSGYLGIKPTTVVKNIFDGTKMPARIPLDPNARGNATTSNTGSSGTQRVSDQGMVA
jgi:hypothetical protein